MYFYDTRHNCVYQVLGSHSEEDARSAVYEYAVGQVWDASTEEKEIKESVIKVDGVTTIYAT